MEFNANSPKISKVFEVIAERTFMVNVLTVNQKGILVLAFLYFLLILPLRWGTFVNSENNVDEGQLLAGAITFAAKPKYYDSIEGTTVGPVSTIILSLGIWAGARASYAYGRIMGALMLIFSALLLFGCFKRTSGEMSTGFLAAAPFVPFFGPLCFFDYVALNGEYAAILCLSLTLFFVGASVSSESTSGRRFFSFALGFTALLPPLAKLQAAPIAAGLLSCFFVGIFFLRSLKERLVAFLLGVVACHVLFFGYLFITHTGQTFWDVYIVQNLIYARANTASWIMRFKILQEMFNVFDYSERFGWFHFVWIIAALTFVIMNRKRLSVSMKIYVAVGIISVILSSYSIMAPANNSNHYFLFEIWALLILAGTLFVAGVSLLEVGTRKRNVFFIVYFLLMWAAPLVNKIDHTRFPSLRREAGEVPMTGALAAKEILKYAGVDDAITVWGWMPRLYVLTQRRQGTLTGHTHWEIEGEKGYLKRFVEKMKENRPVVFVDAVGPSDFGPSLRQLHAHERFPDVNRYVEANYRFVSEIEQVRIYVLNDRMNQR
jgi:hypothetical protein